MPPQRRREPTLDEQIAIYLREYQELDPQVEKVVNALSRLDRRMSVAYSRHLGAADLSQGEWEVLKALVMAGSPYQLWPGTLSNRLGLTPAAITHRIDRLLASGLVTRERDPDNRVRVIVGITDAGHQKWLEVMRLASVFEEGLLQDLDPQERGVLGELLTRLLRRVEDAQPDAGGRLTDLD
ncbi:MarR family winged helix-turn-helix transcriptional regulator [Streptomyces bohaiensis]|uniref:MarR family transcriptional regulator n=1 Tax=Streptomyces bohaiensis TaxID=1431344 RepID=A0ABX1CHE0_9ACTN|nr:MarR family transcriptional regulator [Streptomyces bohaiensis]NJQ17305.1 MarR family transcriptional regulator [Streptomyces bohaiensis]